MGGASRPVATRARTAGDAEGPGTRFVAARMAKDQFTVKHYAGDVTYTAERWLERNTDALPEDLADVARAADFPLLAGLFRTREAAKKRSKMGKDTVCAKFKSQLAALLACSCMALWGAARA